MADEQGKRIDRRKVEWRGQPLQTEGERIAAHSRSNSRWRSENTKTRSIVFNITQARDRELYDYLSTKKNITAYMKDLIERDMLETTGGVKSDG